MHRWVAHGDRVGALEPRHAIAGGERQVFECAVGVADPQVAAAAHRVEIAAMVAKDRCDSREVGRDRQLGDEQDRVRERHGRSAGDRGVCGGAPESEEQRQREQAGGEGTAAMRHG